jgi:hypothetical protein
MLDFGKKGSFVKTLLCCGSPLIFRNLLHAKSLSIAVAQQGFLEQTSVHGNLHRLEAVTTVSTYDFFAEIISCPVKVSGRFLKRFLKGFLIPSCNQALN